MAGPGGDSPVVGEVGDPFARRAPVRVENQREAERLRRLDGAQRGAIGRCENPAGRVDLLDRVAQRTAGTAAPCSAAAAIALAISAREGKTRAPS